VERSGQAVAALMPYQEYDELIQKQTIRLFRQLTRALGDETEQNLLKQLGK
jgi:hypothetical protein